MFSILSLYIFCSIASKLDPNFPSIMDVGLQFDTPRGVMYLPSPPPLEPGRRKSLSNTLKKEYVD